MEDENRPNQPGPFTQPPQRTYRRRGRPRAEPSIVINIRLPLSLLERFNRYLDRRELSSNETVNRGIVIRELLEDMLEREGL